MQGVLGTVFRKFAATPLLVLPLLGGFLLASSLIASIPIFTEGTLTRMLVRDLEEFQLETDIYPGRIYARIDLLEYYTYEERKSLLERFENSYDPQSIAAATELPVVAHATHLVREYVRVMPLGRDGRQSQPLVLNLESLSGFEEHASITHGRMFDTAIRDGVIEIVVTEHALEENRLSLDGIYQLPDLSDENGDAMKVRIVGLYAPADTRDPYWYRPFESADIAMVMSDAAFRGYFIEDGAPILLSARWHNAVQYRDMRLASVALLENLFRSSRRLLGSRSFADFEVPAMAALETYRKRERRLAVTLTVLYVPVVIMIGYLIVMISRLLVEHDRNELALLRSRGATRGQTLGMYALQGTILSLAAGLAGPWGGLLICRGMGSANGFLQFVRRYQTSFLISTDSFAYSAAATAMMLAAMLIPAAMASRASIVEHKSQRARRRRNHPWLMAALEIAATLLSLYGLWRFKTLQTVVAATGLESSELSLDPLLYCLSVLFAFGVCLVGLRGFPIIVGAAQRLGGRRLSPEIYASLTQTARSGSQVRFVMLFLSLAICLGIFSASAGRTINANAAERISYSTGADIVVKQYWEGEQITSAFGSKDPLELRTARTDISVLTNLPYQYREPPFFRYRDLEGIDIATKVFRKSDVTLRKVDQEQIRGTSLMAIVPHEFAAVAWFRPDLLTYHWHGYLDQIARDPKGALLSRSFETDHGVKRGDTVSLTWKGQGYADLRVYGFLDYWPTFNPLESSGGSATLVVANLAYVQAALMMEPYEVWLRRGPDTSSAEVYQQLREQHVPVEYLVDAHQEIIKMKNDPLLQGSNGAMTLGFVFILAAAIIGSLLYWIVSLQSRSLQLGVLRALGLSRLRVILMLVWEQALLVVYSLALGTLGGLATSRLFVPVFGLALDARALVPPFRIIVDRGDYVRLILFMLIAIAANAGIFAALVSRLRVHSALKLGED